MIRKSKNILIVVLLILLALLGFDKYSQYRMNMNEEKIKNSDVVKERLTEISELAVLKYEYKDIAAYEDSKKLNGMKIPLTQKSILIVFEGYLKAGVDLKKADVKVYENGAIRVKMQQASVTDNVVYEDKTVVYDEKSGLFNPVKADDVSKILAKEKERVQAEAVQKGFLKESDEKAKQLVESFVKQMGYSDVVVEIGSQN